MVPIEETQTVYATGDWRDKRSFYKTDNGRCCVCGATESIGIEPRFGFMVCEEHASIPPAFIHDMYLQNGDK